jgi:uncharacterized integral membrane protein (TIGR00697 family)
LFATSITVANITASKLAWFTLPLIGDVSVPAGFIAFGLAFLCSDLMVEYYGKEYAHSVVNGTVIALVFAYSLIYVSIQMPVAPFYTGHEAYVSTLTSSGAVIAASIITIMVSQHIDVRIFSYFKQITSGEHRWFRNIGSTSISQGIDTVIFITLAFSIFPYIQGGNVMWGEALLLTIVGQYIVKLVVAGADTIPLYVITTMKDA